jgi:hypothetical protein
MACSGTAFAVLIFRRAGCKLNMQSIQSSPVIQSKEDEGTWVSEAEDVAESNSSVAVPHFILVRYLSNIQLDSARCFCCPGNSFQILRSRVC